MAEIAKIPGLADLWSVTTGDPAVKIAILDGPADLGHRCFQGVEIRRAGSGWRQDPPARTDFVAHATHVASVIVGNHGDEFKGIAPRCRALNIPVAFDEASIHDPIALARGIDAAHEAGANIIHVATCIRTKTCRGDDFLERAVRNAVDDNILVVAPAGNERGDSWCLPAALPDVLAVGALNDKNVPFEFSNWGGSYQRQGIVAPGENILGAEPGDKFRRHRGTSCAAPIVTGVSGLLMSCQVRRGSKLDAPQIRDAIIQGATACGNDVSPPARCLAGVLNIPRTVQLLFDPRYTRYRETAAIHSPRNAYSSRLG